MRSFVIVIIHHEQSMLVAERCVRSGRAHGIDIEIFPAVTPDHQLALMLEEANIHMDRFNAKQSHMESVAATFLSHYLLWKKCIELDEEINIFEHDAVLLDALPLCKYEHVINWGMPSYGNWKEPKHIGVNKLTTKKWFPGTHAYGVKPEGAKMLVEKAAKKAGAADVYLSLKNFPSLQEYYPHIAEARDTFTTIQKRERSHAKTNFNEDYQYISAHSA